MKVLINLLKFILTMILTIVLISIGLITILFSTVLDKNYIMQKLEETDFYLGTYQLVESNFENYIDQSGLDENVLENICTQEKVKNDINMILSNIYNGKNQVIDTTEIETNLNANIDKLGIKINQNEGAINQFVNHICSEYKNTLIYANYSTKITGVYQNAVSKLNNVYKIMLGVLVIDFIAIIIVNNKKILNDVQSLGTALLACGFFEVLACQIVVAKVKIQGIKVFDDAFSKTLVAIIQEVLQKISSLAVGSIIIAILVIAIYAARTISKKTKENLNTGRK